MLILDDSERTDSLCPAAEDTAVFCLFMDQLFDSVNSIGINPPYGKELRGTVTKNSIHWEFWKESITILESMEFTTSKKVVPSVRNWLKTIKGVMYLSKKLLNNGFSYLSLKNFNQDSIENFFGCIRSHGWRNINPTCANFLTSYKSLVNNFMSSQSIGTNCEKDDCYGALSNLKEFFTTDSVTNIQNKNNTFSNYNENLNLTPQNSKRCKSTINYASRTYVAGWVVKKVKILTNNCRICNKLLTTQQNSKFNSVIEARKYSKSSKLIYPSKEVSDLYSTIIDIFNTNIQNIIHKPKLSEHFNCITEKINHIDLNYFSCPIHNLLEIFIQSSIRLLIFTYVTNINKILNTGRLLNQSDVLMCSASNYYKKHCKKSNK